MFRFSFGLALCVALLRCSGPVSPPAEAEGEQELPPAIAGQTPTELGWVEAMAEASAPDDDAIAQAQLDASSAGVETTSTILAAAQGSLVVAPNSPCIAIEGAMFPAPAQNGGTALNRFDSATLNSTNKSFDNAKAANTTGVALRFTATLPDASNIIARFRFELAPRGISYFSFYRQLDDPKTWTLVAEKGEPVFAPPHATQFAFPGVKGTATYKIVMPHWAAPIFMGLTIAGTCTPQPPSAQNKYIAIGDSITHGTGQNKTNETYPYLLATHFNWELFNLGVGGAQISPALATMIRKKPADIITILIGYNDWNGWKPLDSFATNYKKLIEDIRFVDSQGYGHPKTPIICITPTFTTDPASNHLPKRDAGVTLEQYRAAIRKIVDDRKPSDANIYLIEGTSLINSSSYLSDQVHFNVAGAAQMKKRLVETIPAAALP